ncbi:MAG: transcription termination/antitermination protein NusA [Chloroflexi bacterium]|nr:transcription termination/antitermination protein NusA [Chloroflexota bacterium]
MKSEFALAFNEITERFGLSQDTVMEALKAAMVSAYRRSVNASTAQEIEARIESETGEVRIFSEKEIVDEVLNPLTEVTLEEALQFDDQAEMAGMSLVDSTPEDFGRVAAQTAKQVILQRLREAERDAQYEEYIEREGDMVHGTVHSITPQSVTVGLGRAEAILPRNQQIPGERFHVRDRIRVYVLEVRKSSRGPVIVVSRTHPNMLRRLLEMEVPEINQGLVEIMAIAREAGKRAKVAVAATRDGVDPVGACVGMRGVRIQSIVRDLNDEKIDVIEWNSDAATFISKALSPARVSGVFLDENLDRGKTAMVVVPEDQLSLAIGRAGVNARLSARLTNWRIDIKSLVEAATESLNRLATDKAFAEIAAAEAETMPQIEMILIKKQETRPVTPEEYHLLTDFVVRVEEELMARRTSERQVYLEKLEKIREGVPPGAYQVTLVEAGISTRVANLLTEGEYESAGKVLEQLEIDEDKILALQGVGPKAISELRQTLSAYDYPDPVVEEVAEEAEEEPAAEAEGIEEQPAAEAEATEGEQPALEVEGEPAVQETEGEVTGEAIPIEEAFQRAIEEVGQIVVEADESEKSEAEREAARKKRKQLSRVVEYDPDLGETVSRRVRKESRRTDWQETGEFEE